MIFIIGNEHDKTDPVEDILAEKGKRVIRFNADRCLQGDVVGFGVTAGKPKLYAVIGGEEIDLEDVEAIWYLKPMLPKTLRTYKPEEHRALIHRQFTAVWHALAGILADRRWISPHLNVRQAENKPYQLHAAAGIGFELPDTLISSEPDKVRSFWRACGGSAVVKLLASSPMDDKAVFTNVLEERHLAGIERVKSSPAIFQKLVPKREELRITVVGQNVFAAAIDSQVAEETSTDWRHPVASLPVRPTTIPSDIAEKCVSLVARLGLRYGGIDMIRTPEGRHVFLEINPNGQWHWVQEKTGLPIGAAIADLLAP
ncbi:MAG: MvdC/MvdD family ATP grasp protein [Patescibacteria group bacterium]